MLAFWSPGWTVAGVVLTLGVTAAIRRPLGDIAGLPRAAAIVYLMGLGATLALTLSPRSAHDSYFLFDVTERRCIVSPTDVDFGRLIWAAHWQFNVLLLVPVGAACAWTSDGRWRRRLLAAAASVPILIECIQYAVMSLNRVCEGMDVLTNLAGLLVGYSAARVARSLLPGGSRITGQEGRRQQHTRLDDSLGRLPAEARSAED